MEATDEPNKTEPPLLSERYSPRQEVDLEEWCRLLPSCNIRLLDTVLIDDQGRLRTWLYTSSKSACVCEKERSALNWTRVGKRFLKFAQAARQVAVFFCKNGTKKSVDDVAWERLVNATQTERRSLLHNIIGIQVFYCPGGNQSKYWCRVSGCKNLVCGADSTANKKVSDSLEKKLKDNTLILMKRLNTLNQFEAHYVCDEQGELWLTYIDRVSSLGTVESPLLLYGKKPSLPKLKASSSTRTPSATNKKKSLIPTQITETQVVMRASINKNDDKEEPQKSFVDKEECPETNTGWLLEENNSQIENLKSLLEKEQISRAAESAAAQAAMNSLQNKNQQSIRALQQSQEHILSLEMRCNQAEKKALDIETNFERELAVARSQGLADAALPPPCRNIATLLQQLDAREKALVQAETKWNEERRELEAKAARSSSLAALDAAHRYDNLRSQYEAEQDAAASARAELAAMKAHITLAQKAADESNQEMLRLQAELRKQENADHAMNQGQRISAGLDRAAATLLEKEENNVAPEAEQSTAQARLRQLHNKVVFLKSSLAMEMEARHAAENKLEETLKVMVNEREAAKQQIQDATEEREQALEAAEERFAAALDEAQQRSTQLEAKLAQSQVAYTDALQDAGAARRREETAKAEASRERQARQAADKRAAARSVVNLAESSTISVETKVSPEQSIVEAAVVRRLENEKQYLQAQLTSEAMLKGELQLALKNAGEQLELLRRQNEESVTKAKHNLNQATERYEKAQRESKAFKRDTDSKYSALQSQFNTLQSAYTKTRDALRTEQAEHAATRLARGELLSSISQLRSEQERTENTLKVARDRASDDLAAARLAFEEAESDARDHTKKIQDELSRTLQRLNESRQREFEFEAQVKDLQVLAKQTAHLGRILSTKRKPISRAFSIWLRKTHHKTKILALAEHEKKLNLQLTYKANEYQTLQDKLDASKTSKIEALLASDAYHSARRDEAIRQEFNSGRDRLDACQVAFDAMINLFSKQIDQANACLKNGENERLALAEELRLMLEKSNQDNEKINDLQCLRQREKIANCGHAASFLNWRMEKLRCRARDLNIEAGGLWSANDRCIECPDASILNEALRVTRIAIEVKDDNSIDTALASLAVASAAMAQAEQKVAIDSISLRHELIRERDQYLEKERLEKITKMKSGLEAECVVSETLKLTLTNTIDRVHAADASGSAMRMILLPRIEAELKTKIEKIDSLQVKSVRAMAQANDRHIAALVSGRAAIKLYSKEKTLQENIRQDADMAAGAATLALTEKAADTTESRWRGLVRDAETRGDERQAAAWRAGMEERDRLAKKETSELRAAAEKALAEVKASAAVSLQAVRSDTKKALDKAATLAVQRQTSAVAKIEREITYRLRAEKTDAINACLVAGGAMQTLHLASLKSAQETLRSKLKMQWERELELARKNQTQLTGELQELREKQANEEQRFAQLQAERLIAVERAIVDTEREARGKAQVLALETDRLEADRVASAALESNAFLIEKMNAAEYRRQVEVANAVRQGIEEQEAAVNPLLSRLEVQEERLENTEELLKNTERDLIAERRALAEKHQALIAAQLAASWTQFRLTAAGLRKLDSSRTEFEECQAETEKEFAALQRKYESDQKRAHLIRSQLEDQLAECDKWRHKMHETLVNHERATLMAHKERSAQLGGELEEIVKKRDDAENRKAKLLSYMDNMHTSIRELEQVMRDHSRASAIAPDGRVNVAHAKKKKRMDDDHDTLLSGIEKQRESLSELDNEIATLSDDREAKEDEIKLLERELVELLVTQQKKLLTILQEAASAPREIILDESTSSDVQQAAS